MRAGENENFTDKPDKPTNLQRQLRGSMVFEVFETSDKLQTNLGQTPHGRDHERGLKNSLDFWLKVYYTISRRR